MLRRKIMKTGLGLPVFAGVAIGPAVVYRKAQRTLPIPSGDPALEQAKFDAALVTALFAFKNTSSHISL